MTAEPQKGHVGAGSPAPAELEKRVVAILTKELGLDVPSVQTDLMQSGAIDSMALVELLLHLEATFAIRIELEKVDLNELKSAASIAAFVAKAVANR